MNMFGFNNLCDVTLYMGEGIDIINIDTIVVNWNDLPKAEVGNDSY